MLVTSVISLTQCDISEKKNNPSLFTEQDSLSLIPIIIDSFRNEMNQQWFMTTSSEGISCYDPPNFNPSLKIKIVGSDKIIKNDSLSISNSVKEFYSTNLIQNNLKNKDATYRTVYKNQIDSKINELEAEYKEMEKMPSVMDDILAFKRHQIKEWERKLSLFKTLQIKHFKEPDYNSGIELIYSDSCIIEESVTDSILLGFYKLRELDALKYSGQSYARTFWFATTQKDSLSIQKLSAFKFLHPIKLLDFTKSHYTPIIVEVPPPPLIEE
jgi:hypothetical protein